MIEILKKEIARSIVQLTNAFSSSIEEKLVSYQNNKIIIDIPDGLYSFSGGDENEAFSMGSINDSHNVVDGEITTDVFFGKESNSETIKAHRVNIGDAYNRDTALKIITNPNEGNSIIVYIGDCSEEEKEAKAGIGLDLQAYVKYSVGIMFKILEKDMKKLGCMDYDRIFINASMNIQDRSENTTLLKFENVNERFKTGLYYVVDYLYSYESDIFIDEKMKERLRNFNSEFSIGQEVQK